MEAVVLFIDENSRVDKEALRVYVSGHLKHKSAQAEQLVFGRDEKLFWDKVHNLISGLENKKDKELAKKALRQVRGFKSFLDSWLETAVESPERMEMFVQTKAGEIKSGDEKKDYYWAMQVRHDQLVALVRVTEKMNETIEGWLEKSPEDVLSDPLFRGLGEVTIEDQIFLEAEAIHKKRNDKQ